MSKYNKKGTQVWIKTVKGSPVKMFKAESDMDVPFGDVADVL